jgi:hypothetical protein
VLEEVICAYARSREAYGGSSAARRADLARGLYVRCLDSADVVAQHQGKIAVALIRCGGMTHREVAELMQLPDRTVAAVLRLSLVKQRSVLGARVVAYASATPTPARPRA